jgi:lysophospholipase-3
MTRYLLIMLLIIFIFISIFKVSSTDSRSPIIFIPGSFCSLLEVRINTTVQSSCPISLHNQWILLWLNLRLFEPNLLSCFQNIFKFVYNSSSNSFENPPGVETRIIPNSINGSFLDGILWEYIELDKFRSHFIKNYNYIDGLNLHSIPYDFRRGTNKTLYLFVNNLKQLIESTYVKNQNKNVYLISHSTGGSMILFFLSQQTQLWKDQYVNSWISLSGNIAGEVDNIENLIRGFLSPLISRDVIQSWDFFAWRLPEPMIYGSERIIVQTPSKNYTSYDMLDLLHDVNAIELSQIYLQSSSILGTLPAPNVNTYCFYGVNISTPIGYRSKSDHFDNLETIHGGGDGEQDDTTNMSCQLWKKTMDKKYKLILKGFNRIKHTALVGNNQVLKEIDQIIFSLY